MWENIAESKKKYEVHASYVILHLQYFLTLSEESKKKYEVHASYSFFHSSICIRGQASFAESVFGYEFKKNILNQLKPRKNDLSEIKFIVHAIFYN